MGDGSERLTSIDIKAILQRSVWADREPVTQESVEVVPVETVPNEVVELVESEPVASTPAGNEVTQQAVATAVEVAPVKAVNLPVRMDTKATPPKRRTAPESGKPKKPKASSNGRNGNGRRSDLTEGKPKQDAIPADEDNVRLYLQDIGKVPLLTKEDEVSLAQAYERGIVATQELKDRGDNMSPAERRSMRQQVKEGKQAEEHFVKANLRLVVSIAKRYQASSLPLLDLIQEGNLGLMHAVEKFDWRKGFKFSTYATWWIRQSITRGIANTGAEIRLPVHAHDADKRLKKARSTIEQNRANLDQAPTPATVAELAAELDVSEAEVENMIEYARTQNPDSLNRELTTEHGSANLGDMVGDPTSEKDYLAVERDFSMSAGLEEGLSILDPRERKIVDLRFGLSTGEPLTLEDVGDHFDLTRERIRQIEARAMSKLRHPSNSGRMGVAGDYF